MISNEDPDKSASDGGRGVANDEAIARLMRLAGPRPSIPDDIRNRVHESVRKVWRSSIARRRTFRWGIPTLLAAAVILAVALNLRTPQVKAAPVAIVALVEPDSYASGYPWSSGDKVYPGETIATGSRGMALAFGNGLSLRLAAGTTATIASADEVTVEAGKLYADTGIAAHKRTSITVRTSVGSATDTGTQFAVVYGNGSMSVAVREGRVDISNQRQSYTATTGDRVTLQPDRDVVFGRISPYDGSWEWASALAPAFVIQDRPLLDFLRWASRETGRELVFESEDVRVASMRTLLRGSIAGFTPSEAIDAIMPTTEFEYRMDERRIVIGSIRP